MKKKTFALIMVLTAAASVFTGCTSAESDSSSAKNISAESTSDNAAETSSGELDSISDHHVIEPPAEGWTADELMSVTYLYGKQLEYPLTLASFGDSFELRDQEPNIAGYVHVSLFHDDKIVGNVVFKEKTVDEVTNDTPIDQFMFIGDDSVPDSLVINGKSIDTDYGDMTEYLGEVFENSDSSETNVFYKTKDNSFNLRTTNKNGIFSIVSIYDLCDAK